ncbi:BTAD domain-containing putative transcriptional regulator [Dactylosporangium sp. CA-233914]|uniref:AfsR/SARP family transcriptional regulator n=1 Tax=Dactylosporangium sp. CA-233914 TaxID=3239934 RepID=UPI003D943055
MTVPSRGLYFSVLGPVRVWRDGVELDAGPPQQRVLLAVLLVGAPLPVPLDDLIDALWRGDPPDSARNVVRRYVGMLRRVFEPELPSRAIGRWLRPAAGGYRLDVEEGQVDLLRFRGLAAMSRTAAGENRADEAVAALLDALALWRDRRPPADLDHLRDYAPLGAIEQEYFDLTREAAALAVRFGISELVLQTVRSAALQAPHDESLQAGLIQTLAAAGQRAEALAHFETVRARLADELGIEPGPHLRAAFDAASEEPGQPSVARPAQLPADLPTFSGRREELAATIAAGEHATVVITAVDGMAGVGKTAFAVHWAHRVAGRYPDGQLYVDLRGFDPAGAALSPAAVLHGFLEALGVEPQGIPSSVEAQAALYRSVLAGRRVAVVLDNARDVDQVRPLLPGAPGCVVIVTSRNDLTGLVVAEGAHRLSLDLLPAPDATTMLRQWLGAARVAAEPDATDAIIVHCGRLPLALAIVAARAAAHPGIALSTVADQLRGTSERLDGFAASGPGTHGDLRAVFSWSYRALGDPAARLFRLLGLHPGPDIGLDAAAALAGVPRSEARWSLAELVRASLVTEHRPGRYRCHDLLTAYAGELVERETDEAGRAAAIRRLGDHYLHTAELANRLVDPNRDVLELPPPGPGAAIAALADAAAAMRWLTLEYPVLQAVIRWYAEVGADRHLGLLVYALQNIYAWHGHWHDWVEAQLAAISAAGRLDDGAALGYAYRGLCRAYTKLGRLDDAMAELHLARKLFVEVGDRLGEGTSYMLATGLNVRLNRPGDALHEAQQALELYRAIGSRSNQARALGNLGAVAGMLGDHAAALRHCSAALTLHEELGDKHAQAAAWDTMGTANQELGRLDEAVDCFRRAVELLHDLQDQAVEAETLQRLGAVHAAGGDVESARDAWSRAVAIMTGIDHPGAQRLRDNIAGLGRVSR